MKSKILSNFEAERLEMIKIGINSDGILTHHLKKMVSDILLESFRNYKTENSWINGGTGIILSLGIEIKKWLGDDIDKKYPNKISEISQLQSNIDAVEHKMYLASKKILKEECSELFTILKINAEQGLFSAISYSLRVQIEVSKRV